MKLFILIILAIVKNAVGFDQIFAINAGGGVHTDSDGIVYQKILNGNTYFFNDFTGNIPEKDRIIYKSYDYSRTSDLKYDLPLYSEGSYLLIAKFSYAGNPPAGSNLQNITLNNAVLLQPNVDLWKLCGGVGKICDSYFYFCVSPDMQLHFGNQSTLVQNYTIRINVNRVREEARLAGLVLLKGSLGERKQLISSATSEVMFFDPRKLSSKCSKLNVNDELQKILEGMRQCSDKQQAAVIETVKAGTNVTQSAIKGLQSQHTEISRQIQKSIDCCKENNVKNLTDLLNQQASKIRTEMNASMTQQANMHNQMVEQMNIKFENLLTAVTTEKDQVNKNYEGLLAEVKQLVDDSHKMRSEILQGIVTVALEDQARQASLMLQMSKLDKKINTVLDKLTAIAQN